MDQHSPSSQPASSSSISPGQDAAPQPSSSQAGSQQADPINFAFLKGPKRKRLAKACDACHKSKRRCDGTAPCSNCYFASKDCTYTDASGRPVPAPRSTRPDRAPGSNPRRRSLDSSRHHPPVQEGSSRVQSYNAESSTSQAPPDDSDQGTSDNRKRCRYGDEDTPSRDPSPEPAPPFNPLVPVSRLDPYIVRELVNLFFAHCHPQRNLIHKPSFSAALSHSRTPCYLLYAICALAAPMSKQRAVKTVPPRMAGVPYGQLAMAQMFDQHGRLIVEHNLVTVQALMIIQSHEMTVSWPWTASTRYQDLALKILEEDLKVHEQNYPILTPVPTPEFVFAAIDRECARRAFWLIRFMHLTAFTFYYVPIPPKPLDLSLRLPVDETSFELGVHSTLSEYLHVPAPKTQYASEFGHLIRMAQIRWNVESTLRDVTDRAAVEGMVNDAEKALATWDASLPDHLRFNEESLQLQLSMFDTSSNAGAWCYFMTHIIHTACVLMVYDAKFRTQGLSVSETRSWARERMLYILTSIGNRAKNSFLAIAAFSPLYKYDLADHPTIQSWSKDFEAMWGSELSQVLLYGLRQSQQQQQQTASLESSASASSSQLQHQALNPLQSHRGPPQPISLPHPASVPQQFVPAPLQSHHASQSQSNSHNIFQSNPYPHTQTHAPSLQLQQQQQRLPHSRNTATNLLGLTDLAIHDSDTPLDSGSGASGSSGSTPMGMMGPPASTSSLGRSYGKMRITDEAMPMSGGGLGPGISGRGGGSGGLASAGNILNDMAGMGPGGMSGGMGSMGGGGLGGGGSGGGGAGGSSLPSLKASGLLDSWVPPNGNGRSSPSQSRLPTPPWIALMAQSAANAAPHASQNATVTIATSIAELSPSDAISKLGSVGGGGEGGGGMGHGSGHGHGYDMGMESSQQQYGMNMGGMGNMGKDGHGDQGHGQGISGGMMMTDSVGLGGAGGKSTMPVGLPWLEHERPR